MNLNTLNNSNIKYTPDISIGSSLSTGRVRVYFNLHKKKFSVVPLTGSNKGRVSGHYDRIVLTNCSYRVQPAGRAKVLREKRKNVHAFIYANIVFNESREPSGRMIAYNPYKHSSFVYIDNHSPIHYSNTIELKVVNEKPILKLLT